MFTVWAWVLVSVLLVHGGGGYYALLSAAYILAQCPTIMTLTLYIYLQFYLKGVLLTLSATWIFNRINNLMVIFWLVVGGTFYFSGIDPTALVRRLTAAHGAKLARE